MKGNSTTTSQEAGDVRSEFGFERKRFEATMPRIIFIIGWGRSGSTLLGNALGELQDCVHVGELHDLWSAYAERSECGCGLPLTECPFWARVASADSTLGRDLQSAAEILRIQQHYIRIRHVPRMIHHLSAARPAIYPTNRYSEVICRLLRSVAAVAKAEVVVDSTKSPAAAALLLGLPLQTSFVHLVRDPRATGFSWRRHRNFDLEGTREQTRIGYSRNAASWLLWNTLAELIRRQVEPRRWLRVRYEDFASAPENWMRHIASKFELPTSRWPLRGHVLELGTHHTIEGNPSRFKIGPRHIQIDDEWSKQMSRVAQALSVAITAPLFLAYNYHSRGVSSGRG